MEKRFHTRETQSPCDLETKPELIEYIRKLWNSTSHINEKDAIMLHLSMENIT